MMQLQSFSELMAAFKRRFFVMLLVVVAGCALSVYLSSKQVKMYEATAVVQIEAATISNTTAGQTATSDVGLRFRLIEQKLMSRDSLTKIIEKHNLYSDKPDLSVGEKVFNLRTSVRIEKILNAAQAWQPGTSPSGLTIYARMSDPVLAAEIANEFMNSVIEFSRERNVNRAEDTVAFFAAEETRFALEIETLSAQIAAFKSANSNFLPAGQAASRVQLADLREAELDLDQQILTMKSGSSRQRLEVIEGQINLLETQKNLISERIREIEVSLLASPRIEQDYNTLQLRLDRLQEQYTIITRRKSEAEMGQLLEDQQQGGRFEVLESALVPDNPVTRSRKKTAIMGGVASVLAAIGIGFMLELMNPVIRSAAQMERAIGMQPVISIPHIGTKSERRRGGLLKLLGILAVLAGVAAFVRQFHDKLSGMGLLPWTSVQQP